MRKINIEDLQKRRYEIYQKEKENLLVNKIPDGYSVSNLGKASSYTVSKVDNKIVCSCKDFDRFKEYGINCKHQIAVLEFVKAQAKAQKHQVKEVNTISPGIETVNETKSINYIKKEDDVMNSNNQNNNNQVTGKFNPEKYITRIKKTEKGNVVYKDYLEVKYRVHWFRTEHPDWPVLTEVINIDPISGYALVKASIINKDGIILSTGHSLEYRKNFFDFVEKAETSAVGRALSLLGYGTLQCQDLDEGKLADAPVAIPQKPTAPTRPAPSLNLPSPTAPHTAASGRPMTEKPYVKPTNGTSLPLAGTKNNNGNNGNGNNGNKKYNDKAEIDANLQKYIDRW